MLQIPFLRRFDCSDSNCIAVGFSHRKVSAITRRERAPCSVSASLCSHKALFQLHRYGLERFKEKYSRHSSMKIRRRLKSACHSNRSAAEWRKRSKPVHPDFPRIGNLTTDPKSAPSVIAREIACLLKDKMGRLTLFPRLRSVRCANSTPLGMTRAFS